MGNTQTKIKCYNSINSKFTKDEENYYMKLCECSSTFDASFLREFPKGCYTYVCEDCYRAHYQNEKVDLDKVTHVPKNPENINLTYDEDTYTYSSTIPTNQKNREMIQLAGENKITYQPVWKEIPLGVNLI